MKYWAVRPADTKNYGLSFVRIEHADNARQAAQLAFGRGVRPGQFLAKDLGSRVAVLQSDNRRIALLQDPAGWEEVK